MSSCPCGSNLKYSDCCEPALKGTTPSKTAEALMRSRYSAYVKNYIAYLGDTLHPDHKQDWDEDASQRWADNSDWLSLEIISTENGQIADSSGRVEFLATFKEDGQIHKHHEISRFLKDDEQWFYVDGVTPKPETVRNEKPKVGRNSPCPCGSGKKYKKCCA